MLVFVIATIEILIADLSNDVQFRGHLEKGKDWCALWSESGLPADVKFITLGIIFSSLRWVILIIIFYL